MSERLVSLEDYILHECAPRFLVELFTHYMCHEYEVHSLVNAAPWTCVGICFSVL